MQKIEHQPKVDDSSQHSPKPIKGQGKGHRDPFKTFTHVSSNVYLCRLCEQNDHFISNCKSFLDLTVDDRINHVNKVGLCSNCLRKHSNECRSGHCKKCTKFHSTLLHRETSASQTSKPTAPSLGTLSNHSFIYKQSEQVLATARILILDKNSIPVECTALLDCGSMRSYMTSSLCKKLALETFSTDMSVIGINQIKTKIMCYTTAKIKSRHEDFSEAISFLILPKITETFPAATLAHKCLQLPDNISLANPGYAKTNKIDILLGVDIFWRLISADQPYLKEYPYLIKSVFGYVVSGNFQYDSANRSCVTTCNVTLSSLSKQLSRFWEQESCENDLPIFSLEQKKCEENFIKTTKRNEQGKFIVTIPLSSSPEMLGDSKARAVKQFFSLEKRLNSNKDLKNMYTDFMLEYEQLGHMIKINEGNDNASHTYYMPHHCVLREQSLTTKLRVVFNSSSPSSSGLSFNDIQMNGPILQNYLFSILIRFRRFKYVLSSDCSKMFRCVLVTPEQRSLQRILWRPDTSLPLETYELCTVTYGQKASSYLAIRCLFELADLHFTDHPEICDIIKKDMYCATYLPV